jgi:hypothetical protein
MSTVRVVEELRRSKRSSPSFPDRRSPTSKATRRGKKGKSGKSGKKAMTPSLRDYLDRPEIIANIMELTPVSPVVDVAVPAPRLSRPTSTSSHANSTFEETLLSHDRQQLTATVLGTPLIDLTEPKLHSQAHSGTPPRTGQANVQTGGKKGILLGNGLQPPVFSTMSHAMKKKVARLPDPNEFEQKCLDTFEKRFIKGQVDLSLESPMLYSGLKKGAKVARRRKHSGKDLAASRSLFKRKKKPQASVPKMPSPSKAQAKPSENEGKAAATKAAEETEGGVPGREKEETDGPPTEGGAAPNVAVAAPSGDSQVASPPENRKKLKTANSDRIFEEIDASQPTVAYGEDYRNDRFSIPLDRGAGPPKLTPPHEELVVQHYEDEMKKLTGELGDIERQNELENRGLKRLVKVQKVRVLAFQDKEHEETKMSFDTVGETIQKIDDTIEQKLKEARDSLPENFLFEHGLGKFVKERGANTVLKCFRRLQNQLLHTGMEHWQSFLKMERHAEKVWATIVLQKIARGFLARLEMELIRKEKIIQDEREHDRLARLFKLRYDSAVYIQKMYRGKLGRRFVRNQYLRIESALVIQRFVRYTQSKFLLLMKRAMWLRKNGAATIIQCCWRGMKGRYRARIVRKIRRAEKMVEWEEEKHFVLQDAFKKEGAAVQIQYWWIMVRLRHEFLRMRKLLKRRRVSVLQRAYRCYRARVRAAELRAIRDEKLAKDNAAALSIQKAWHRKRAYMRVRAKLRQIEEEKAKHLEKLKHQGEERKIHLKILSDITGDPIDINMTTVHRKLFHLRKMLNPFEKAREEKAALKLQKCFRGMRARKRLGANRQEHHLEYRRNLKLKRLEASKTIQRFWRGLVGRRLFLKARRIRMAIRVQARFRGWKGRQLALVRGIQWYAAIRIQASFRGYYQRIHFQEYVRQTKLTIRSATTIERIARGFICRMHYEKELERQRWLSELRMRGRTELQACALLARDHLLLKEAKKSKKFKGATQALFHKLCEMSRSKEGISNSMFLKLGKECGFVDNRRVKLNTLDLAISKAKGNSKTNGTGTGAGNLTYPEFAFALRYLADTRYKKTEAVRRQTGSDARMVKFCFAHILTDGTGDAKMKRQHLKKHIPKWVHPFCKRMDELQDEYLGLYARKIQGHIRGEIGRNMYAAAKVRIKKERERTKMIRASLMISKHQRIRKAKRVLANMAGQIIQKYVDPKTGFFYYYNPRTGHRSVKKPEILGSQDVAKPFELPDKHTEYVVLCANCSTKSAKVFCEPCGDAYCNDCFTTLHSKGKKASHHRDKMPMCSYCEYQAATRYDRFHKQFCDSCYDYQYEDTMQAKTYTHIVLPCCECNARACKWRCKECEDVFCTPCFGKIHSSGKRALHTNIPLTYYTVKMESQRLAMEREAKRKIAAAEKESRMGIVRQEKLEYIARKLQALWRGRQGRAEGKAYLKVERKKMRHHYRQSKVDNNTKKTAKYMAASIFGVEKILETDTPRTRARKERALLRDPTKALKHLNEHAFEFQIKEEGKLLPHLVNCYPQEVEFETLGDLRDHLKPGDRVRIGVADSYVINVESDVDPDKDEEEKSGRKYTHQFMCLDRPWATEKLLNTKIYKLRPPPRKIGLNAELKKLAMEKTKGLRGVYSESTGAFFGKLSNAAATVGKATGIGMAKKAADFYKNTADRAISHSLQPERTPGAFEKERRYWTENDNGDGTFYYYNRITDETTWEKPECLLNAAEMKEFKRKEAEKKAREDEIAAQKQMLEFKKAQREKAKAGRGGRGKGRRR